jgi:RNA polymerase-binding transcription factor DksA
MATKAKKVKKAPAKKAAPKKVAKMAARKVAPKKSAKKVAPKKKVAVKKVAAKKQVKKVVKKPVVKKAVAKKPAAKKPVAKKPAAKKSSAKKFVKKVAPKKASPKKVVKKQVKKVVPKKVVSKVANKKQVALKAPVKKVAPKQAQQPAVKASKMQDAPNIKKEIKIDEDGKAHVQERYSDADLQMFKEVILKKLAQAKDDYEMLRAAMTHSTSNDIEDTSPTFKVLEEGATSLSKEESGELAQRQYKFIQSLEAALVRIENKTYGISRISGKLIPKARLLLVPHATLSVEDKNKQ